MSRTQRAVCDTCWFGVSVFANVAGRCAAAYLGDIALTEDELELIGGAVTAQTTSRAAASKPSSAVVSTSVKPPPASPPLPLSRAELERRGRQRRRRRRKHRGRMSSSFDVVVDTDGGKVREHRRREHADVIGGGNVLSVEQRTLKRLQRANRHRQSAEQTQHKRYVVGVSSPGFFSMFLLLSRLTIRVDNAYLYDSLIKPTSAKEGILCSKRAACLLQNIFHAIFKKECVLSICFWRRF